MADRHHSKARRVLGRTIPIDGRQFYVSVTLSAAIESTDLGASARRLDGATTDRIVAAMLDAAEKEFTQAEIPVWTTAADTAFGDTGFIAREEIDETLPVFRRGGIGRVYIPNRPGRFDTLKNLVTGEIETLAPGFYTAPEDESTDEQVREFFKGTR